MILLHDQMLQDEHPGGVASSFTVAEAVPSATSIHPLHAAAPRRLLLFRAACIAFAFLAGSALCHGGPGAYTLLKRATKEKVPARRVVILNQALTLGRIPPNLRSRILFERGKAYKEQGDCFRAIKDFNAALRRAKDKVPILVEKTHCLILVDQLERASRVLEIALSARPRNSRSYVLKGLIYENRGFLSRAEDEYTRALHYDPKSTWALKRRADVLLREGKPRQALKDLDALIGMDPGDTDVLIRRARVRTKLRDYKGALKDYSRAEELTKDKRGIILEKALVYLKTGEPRKALEALSAEKSRMKSDSALLVIQARARILLKDLDKASALLNRVIRAHPSDAPAHLYLGVVAMARKKWDEALAHLDRALELDHSLVEAHKVRARVFMKLGDPVRALADLKAAADMDPSDAGTYVLLGRAQIGRKLYSSAIMYFTRALECLPGDPRILFDRAVSYAKIEDWEAALGDLNRLLAKRPNAARALSLRGIVLCGMGRTAEGRQDLYQAVEAGPSDATVWNNRGFFLYKTGHYEAAVKDFNKALQLDPYFKKARYNLNLALRKQEQARSERGSAGSIPARGTIPLLSSGSSTRKDTVWNQ